jgi:ribosomal-protein-alanine N-acetyltransferase
VSAGDGTPDATRAWADPDASPRVEGWGDAHTGGTAQPPLPSFVTERLWLRVLTEDDEAEFVRTHALSREHYAPWSPIEPPGLSAEGFFRQQLQRCRDGLRHGTDYRFVAIERAVPGRSTGGAEDRIVGFFGLNNIVRGVFQNAYAGWRVCVDQLGKGYATEGVRGLVDFALARPPRGLGLHRVQANIMPHNPRSIRVAEKCGFRLEGRATRYLMIAGAWQDHLMYARTFEDATDHV